MRPHQVLPVLAALVSCTPFLSAQQVPHPAEEDDAEIVVAWIRQNAIPLRHVGPGHGFEDLQPLKTILKDVTIVGLGESTHGTREFQLMKHRLLEFLVTQMGFRALAMETAFSDAQPIDDYILHGTGDLSTVLSGQGYLAWDTEEFAAMLDWIRAYNQGVPDSGKVRFYGLDLFRNELGRSAVLDYLRRYAPARVSVTDSVFRVLEGEEARWPLWDAATTASARSHLEELLDYLQRNTSSLQQVSSAAELDRVVQYLRVMLQGLVQATGIGERSRFLGENLDYLMERAQPGTRFVFWAANAHVSKGDYSIWEGTPRAPFTGNYIRRRHGDRYYAFGFELGRGTYRYRVFPPPQELRIGSLPPAPVGSLPWHLSRAGAGNLILDLRQEPDDSVVVRWLDAPQPTHGIGWGNTEAPASPYTTMSIREHYDGILFIDSTTATTPTTNALRTAAEKRGF